MGILPAVTKWFGEPWPSAEQPAPVCADPQNRVPTPVGQRCFECTEAILEGSRGVLIPFRGPTSDSVEPWHLECLLYNTLGPSWVPFLP